MRVLVTGWFSFDGMGASAGDLLSRDVICQWLDDAGCGFDVALAPPFSGGVRWEGVPTENYSHVLFVCGPLGNGPPVDALFRRFKRHRLIGINVSMLESLDKWNPFDLLLERDSSAAANPDLAFLSQPVKVPLVGIVRIDAQPEYGDRDLIPKADAAIDRLLRYRDLTDFPIDTRLDLNRNGFTKPSQIESALGRMDTVITTRLHGMVLSLKQSVPVVAIDSVAGGDKVSRQAEVIGWPMCFRAADVTDDTLQTALEFCLSKEGRAEAEACRVRCRKVLTTLKWEFFRGIRQELGISEEEHVEAKKHGASETKDEPHSLDNCDDRG